MEVLSVERPESNGHAHATEPDEWLSTQQAAAFLCTSGHPFNMYVGKGILRRRGSPGMFEYHKGDLERIKARREVQAALLREPQPDGDEMCAKQVACVLDVTVKTVRNWWDHDALPYRIVRGDRYSRRADVDAFKARRENRTALVPVAPAVPILLPADPLAQLLAEYREAAARLAVARHDHEEAARREQELHEEVNVWGARTRLLREQLDKGLDEVAGEHDDSE